MPPCCSLYHPVLVKQILVATAVQKPATWTAVREKINRFWQLGYFQFPIYTPVRSQQEQYIYIYMSPVPGPHTPHPPPPLLPPQWYPPPPPLLTPPTPQNLVFACYLHIYIHIYTYILPFPPLQPRISTLFAALESHDLVNGPCLPVYFYHKNFFFFEPPIACLAHGLQHICYLWITQSLPMQT